MALDSSKELTNSEVEDYFIKDYGTISKNKIIEQTKKYDIKATIIKIRNKKNNEFEI